MAHNLREELDRIVEAHAFDLAIQRTKTLAWAGLHGINLELRQDGERMGPVNCHRYSLGLGKLAPRMEALLERAPFMVVDGKFMLRLIEDKVLVHASDVRERAVVVYENDQRITHSGRVFSGDMVASKWGGGHVWAHRPLDVPASYGDKLTYYRLNRPDNVREELERYCIAVLREDVVEEARNSDVMPFREGYIPEPA